MEYKNDLRVQSYKIIMDLLICLPSAQSWNEALTPAPHVQTEQSNKFPACLAVCQRSDLHLCAT